MFKLKGNPEEDEIVLCKVKKIYPSSVFVDILEYSDSGMVHISEVSPGRIRNLRDYVSEGRQIVCKVLRVDKEKGHIDLSLRRVNSNQRREKLDEIKQELKAESLIKTLSKRLKTTPEALYKQLTDKIFPEYSHLHLFFKEMVHDEHFDLAKFGLDAKIVKELKEAVSEKFKPKKVILQGEIGIKTYHSEGVDKIKKTLMAIEKVSETVNLFYLGAGKYKLVIEDFDYKLAEKTVKDIQKLLDHFNDKQSTAVFEREKND